MAENQISTASHVSENKFKLSGNALEGEKLQDTVDENSKSSPKRNESLEATLRRFKKQSSGIISEIRKREAYDKPSVKRKKKSKEARRHKKMGRYNSGKW